MRVFLTVGVFFTCNAVNVLGPTSVSNEGIVDWEGVGSNEEVITLFWENEVRSSWVDSFIFTPIGEGVTSNFIEVIQNSWHVESPLPLSINFSNTLSENSSQFFILSSEVDSSEDSGLSSSEWNRSQIIQSILQILEDSILGIADWGIIKSKESSSSVKVLDGGSQGESSSQTMST